MRNILTNCVLGAVAGLVLASCVATPDGGHRAATPDEAAQIVDDAVRVVAPATGTNAPIVAAIGGIVAVALREWGRISAMKDATKAQAKVDAAWDEAHKLPPPETTDETKV